MGLCVSVAMVFLQRLVINATLEFPFLRKSNSYSLFRICCFGDLGIVFGSSLPDDIAAESGYSYIYLHTHIYLTQWKHIPVLLLFHNLKTHYPFLQVVNGLLQREDWDTAVKVPLGIIPAGWSLFQCVMPQWSVELLYYL